VKHVDASQCFRHQSQVLFAVFPLRRMNSRRFI